jgi:hypothetical protein
MAGGKQVGEWANQVEQHPIHDALRSAGAALESILAHQAERDSDTTERLARIQQVISDVIARIDSTDAGLIPLQALNNLHPPVQRITDNLANYQSGGQPDQVAAAHNQLENILVHLNLIPAPRTTADVEGIREAATSLRRSLGQNVRQLESRSAEAQSMLASLDQQLRTVEARMAESQQRLDARIGEAEQRLTAAETQRTDAFDSAQSQRERRADELLWAKSAAADAALKAQRAEFDAIVGATVTELDSLRADLATQTDTLIEEMEAQKAQAQKMVGIITETGLIGGFQKEADAAQSAGTIWRVTAAAALGALVVFAVYVFISHNGQAGSTTWADVGWRIFVASAVGLFAAYAARQADKHDRTRKRSRRMELELASISPYLDSLPQDQQVEMKMDLARRLFGQDDAADTTDATTGTQVDLAKMIIENATSFMSK